MAKINGSTLFVFVGTDKIAKTTAYNLSVEMEQIDKVSNESGFFKDHLSRIGSWTLSSDSLLIYDGYSYGDLFDAYVNRERVWLSLGGDDDYTLIGEAMVESISKSSPLDEAPTISISFKGVGKLYPTIIPEERYIIDELYEIIIDQSGNFLVYT